MNPYFDRQGNPISLEEWLEKFPTEKRVAETTLANGKWVSTVWLGINHRFTDGPPHIFETMLFASKKNMQELDIERYATEEDAIKGHKRMVEKWSTN